MAAAADEGGGRRRVFLVGRCGMWEVTVVTVDDVQRTTEVATCSERRRRRRAANDAGAAAEMAALGGGGEAVALCHDMIMIYVRIICFLCFEGTHML